MKGMKIHGPIPSLPTLFFETALFFLVNDFVFYWSHRLLHHPRLYKIHKKHHQYYVTTGLAAEFAHPVT